MTSILLRPDRAVIARLGTFEQRPLMFSLLNLPVLLDQLDVWAGSQRSDATVIVRGAPGIVRDWSAHITDGKVGPHTVTGGRIGAWTSMVREFTGRRRRRAIHIGIAELIEPRKNILFHPLDDDDDTIVRRLHGFHISVGAPWHMTGGVSGCASIKAMFNRPFVPRGQEPYWGIGGKRPIADERTAAGDLAWERALTPQEAACAWVHAVDLNAARLSAARVQELPIDRLQHTQAPPPFDPGQVGYWLARGEDLPRESPFRPPLLPTGRNPQGLAVLTAPLMGALAKQGHHVEAVEAWTSPASKWLYDWAARVDGARLTTLHYHGKESPEYRSLRAVWTETFGMIERDGGSIHLPCAAHSIIDRQRVTVTNHIRRAYQSLAVYPFRVLTDALWYVSNSPDPAALPFKLGSGLGEWKVVPGYPVPMSTWMQGADAVKAYVKENTNA